jgi:hypothetical protein
VSYWFVRQYDAFESMLPLLKKELLVNDTNEGLKLHLAEDTVNSGVTYHCIPVLENDQMSKNTFDELFIGNTDVQ